METAHTAVVLDLLIGALVSAPFAVAANRFGKISRAGALAGITCGAVIYSAFYLAGYVVLGVALALTMAASRLRASERGAAADDHRGAANIVANCGVGMLAALVELFGPFGGGLRTELTALWCVTAIAAGASDTVASEIGKAFGGQPRAFPTFRLVAAGTPGGVSLIGTVAGIVSALLIALPAAVLWLLPWDAVWMVAAACTFGAFVESALGTAFDRGSDLTNHLLNGVNTTAASVAALTWALYSRP